MPTALLIQYVSELAASEQLQTSISRKAFNRTVSRDSLKFPMTTSFGRALSLRDNGVSNSNMIRINRGQSRNYLS
jgi:hypothetical protein